MSFYTSLTGLNGAQADIAAISNNIANVGTTGFKRSRAEFGDIFATSPLQAASSAIGSGTILKSIKQQFTQGNIESSLNALDLAISGQGFFAVKPSLTSTQTVYTRNGAFSVNNDRYVVDSQGQLLQVFPVNADGSVIATGIQSAQNLQLPTTSGLPKASQTIQLGLNLPADAEIIPNKSTYSASNPYVFDKTNPATYNKSTSITIYDSLGNPTIATIYYVKTSNATETSPTNKWQTHVFVGDREVTPQLITSKDDQGKTYYINKFGQITTEPEKLDPTFNKSAGHPLYKQDDQTDKTASTAASVVGSIIRTTGFDFGDTDANKVTIVTDPAHFDETREGGSSATPPAYWGADMFTISVDGSAPQSISINAGTYTGTQLAAEMTRAVNAKFGSTHYFRINDTVRRDGGAAIPGNDIIQLNLSKLNEDGSSAPMTNPIEIDLLGTGGSAGTPAVKNATNPEKTLQLTRDQLLKLAQTKLNDVLNERHNEFGKAANWVDASKPPIVVGYDVSARALTFTVDPTQLGPDANEPASRFNSLQVFNPTDASNDLGIPNKTTSSDVLIRANTVWTGNAALPGGDPIVDPREQRTGIQAIYNKDTRQFSFSSGSTGETSSITVGRSPLATASSGDIKEQVNSYDFSDIKLDEAQMISLEIDGRTVTYEYTPPVSGTPTLSNLLAGIEQAIPVSFNTATKDVVGTLTTQEKQTLSFGGKPMNGDQFTLTLPNPGGQTSPLTVGPLGIAANASAAERLAAVAAAINNAIQAEPSYLNAQGAPIATVRIGKGTNALEFTYTDTVAVGSLVSMKQTIRGSDAGLKFVPLQDRTVTSGTTITVAGSGVTGAEHRVPLFDANTVGGMPTILAGEVYRITVPLQNGGQVTHDVTVTAAGGMAGLIAGANAAGFTNVKFNPDTANPNVLVVAYNTPGNVTGSTSIEQIQRAGTVDVTPHSSGVKSTIGADITTAPVGTTNQTTSGVTAVTGNAAIQKLASLPTTAGNYSLVIGGTPTALTVSSPYDDAAWVSAINSAGLNVTAAPNTNGGVDLTFSANGPQQLVSMTQTSGGSTTPVGTVTQTTAGITDVTGVPEVQELDISGLTTPANGDQFVLTMPGGQPTTITLTADGTTGLLAAINSASQPTATATLSGNNIVFTYSNNGPVSGTINLATPVAAVAETQTIEPATALRAGETYTLSIPAVGGGSATSITVTLTTGGLTDLKDKLNAAGTAPGTFSISTSNPKLLSFDYTAAGAVTGSISMEGPTGTPANIKVRPDSIGAISAGFGYASPNLKITGSPDGSPFRLALRVNGELRTMLPVGASNSDSQAGVRVGQAKSIGYSDSNDLLGIGSRYSAQQRFVAGTGLSSSAATAVGSRGITPMNQTFFLNEGLGENRMTFTVDGIVGTITLPIRAYTGDTFASAIEDRVNQIQDPKTGRTVSGVTVKYEPDSNRLVFTSGTTGANSQINVVGHANFGLANVTQTPGSVPVITNLKQATDEQGNKLYVDAEGNISTQSPSSTQNWYPLYLQEGQLTFDTVGKLISPKEGVIYSPFDPQNGSDLLRLTIDYGKFSTQYSSPFSVLSLSQDGYPSGSLNGLDIDASGTVRANYTNGQTVALGKVMIANFANPNGLKQVGNANYVATSVSGQVVLGQAGADGFGTIKAGALERSNVDITEELVNLITAQRNFQANAKAIKTTTTLSQTIIQIRG